MKAVAFDYQRFEDLANSLSALQDESGGVIKVMGGSQSLGPMLNLRLARPNKVVDVSGVKELREVSSEGDWIRIGAAVTHAQIEDGVFPLLRNTLLAEVAPLIAYRAIRNRGTIGGSLAHADPAADWVLVTFAIGAQLELASAQGTRTITMPEFMLGAYTTVLAENEIISAVRVPALGAGGKWGYHKLCRKTGEFAEASCSAIFDPDKKICRIALGALDGPPAVMTELAEVILNKGYCALTVEMMRAAIQKVAPDKDDVDQQLCLTALRRCLASIFQEQQI